MNMHSNIKSAGNDKIWQYMNVCLHRQTEQVIEDEKNGKREEGAESQMVKKNTHLACSQFSFPTEVRQRSYSNDHEQKSFFHLYSVA